MGPHHHAHVGSSHRDQCPVVVGEADVGHVSRMPNILPAASVLALEGGREGGSEGVIWKILKTSIAAYIHNFTETIFGPQIFNVQNETASCEKYVCQIRKL